MDIISLGERTLAAGEGPPPKNCDFRNCSGSIYINKLTGELFILRNFVWSSKVVEHDFSFDDGLFEDSTDLLHENECYLQATIRQAELVSKNFFVGQKNFFFEIFFGELNTSEFSFNIGFYNGDKIIKVTSKPEDKLIVFSCNGEKLNYESIIPHQIAISRVDGTYNLIINNFLFHHFQVNSPDTHIGYASLQLNDGYIALKKAAFAKGE